ESSSTDRIFASPLARKIAEDKGINLSEVKGSGENGRIVKQDVENYTPKSKSTTSQAPSATVSEAKASSAVTKAEVHAEEVKNSQMRKTIARRLSESKFT